MMFILKFSVCSEPSVEALSRFSISFTGQELFLFSQSSLLYKHIFFKAILNLQVGGYIDPFCRLGGLLSWGEVCCKIISSVLPVTYFDTINKSTAL